MPFIEKRGPNRWKARYRAPDGRERSKTFPRKVDAERFLSRVEIDKLEGRWIAPELAKTLLGTYAEQWAATKANVRDRTRVNIEGRLRNHILPAFEDRPLVSIRPEDVRTWIAGLTARDLAPSTVKATYRTFGQIMRTAEVDGLIHRSPCLGIELPAETSREEMTFLTPERVNTLADAITPRYRSRDHLRRLHGPAGRGALGAAPREGKHA